MQGKARQGYVASFVLGQKIAAAHIWNSIKEE